jgi:hypothetical protein
LGSGGSFFFYKVRQVGFFFNTTIGDRGIVSFSILIGDRGIVYFTAMGSGGMKCIFMMVFNYVLRMKDISIMDDGLHFS